MLFHRLNKESINNFINHPLVVPLILSGIASINSNIKLFGGQNSTNFKIKIKKVNQYLKKILS